MDRLLPFPMMSQQINSTTTPTCQNAARIVDQRNSPKADWLVGINFSRLFSCLYNAHLNIGRVQTPTLNLIVQREEEIKNFTPKKYYTITLNFDGMKAESDRFDDYYDALKQHALCNRSTAMITTVDRKIKEIKPPKLFNLADLQKKANELLGYTAKQTLDIAQELYEKKLITYPRTESNFVTSGMENKIIQLIPLTNKFMDMEIFSANIKVIINDKKGFRSSCTAVYCSYCGRKSNIKSSSVTQENIAAYLLTAFMCGFSSARL